MGSCTGLHLLGAPRVLILTTTGCGPPSPFPALASKFLNLTIKIETVAIKLDVVDFYIQA